MELPPERRNNTVCKCFSHRIIREKACAAKFRLIHVVSKETVIASHGFTFPAYTRLATFDLHLKNNSGNAPASLTASQNFLLAGQFWPGGWRWLSG